MINAAKIFSVDAEVRAPTVHAQLVRFHMHEPIDNVLRRDAAYWLDLSLTPRPRNTRARYCDRWDADHFERVGSIFFVPPGEGLQFKNDGGMVQSSILCLLQPEALGQWFGGDLKWTDQRLAASVDVADANVRYLLMRLGDELRHPGFASNTLVELIAAQLAIELNRYCVGITERLANGGLAPWRLRLIDERLRDVLETPTLAELAGLCGISIRQLTRGFRVSRGHTIGDYVAKTRLDHAKRLLATDTSIKAVAYTLGFSSPSSFCDSFRRTTGQTPGEHRQNAIRGHRH